MAVAKTDKKKINLHYIRLFDARQLEQVERRCQIYVLLSMIDASFFLFPLAPTAEPTVSKCPKGMERGATRWMESKGTLLMLT